MSVCQWFSVLLPCGNVGGGVYAVLARLFPLSSFPLFFPRLTPIPPGAQLRACVAHRLWQTHAAIARWLLERAHSLQQGY